MLGAMSKTRDVNSVILQAPTWHKKSMACYCSDSEAAVLREAIGALPFDEFERICVLYTAGASPHKRFKCCGSVSDALTCDRTWNDYVSRRRYGAAEHVAESITAKMLALTRFGRIALLEAIHQFYVYRLKHGPDIPADAMDEIGVCCQEKSNHRRLKDARFWRAWA